MSIILAVVVLLAIDVYLVQRTGGHIPKWLAKKYAEYQQSKDKKQD